MSGALPHQATREVIVFENSYKLTNHLLTEWIEDARQAISRQGYFAVSLSGGQTPKEFLCKLSNIKDVDLWTRTVLFQTDERFVPQDNERNNFRSLQQWLINYISIPSDNVFSVMTDMDDLEECVDLYQNDVENFFRPKVGSFPEFDWMLLGMGEDGHTASLFPGDPALDQTRRLVSAVRYPKVKDYRISLTLPVINHARRIVCLVTGAGKARRIADVLNRRDLFAPVSRVGPVNREARLTFYLDRDAASELDVPDNSFEHCGEGVRVLF